nr:hypothetical protein [Tanacetum cinerariifolium]
MIVKSVLFSSNNFVGNFSYLQSVPAYKDICKFLRNCFLAEAFMKTPTVLYWNYLREFWCTAMVEDLNLSTEDSEARPLKEFIIKFTVKNGQTPLTIDYKTFYATKRLDYNKEVEPDTKTLLLTTVADIQALLGDSEDEHKDASAKEILEAGEELDEEFLQTFKPFDNNMPVTERVLARQLQGILKKILTKFKSDHVTRLNKIFTNLKEVQDAIKEDSSLNKKVLKAAEAYEKKVTSVTKLLTLVKNFDFPGFKTIVESLQAVVIAQNDQITK